MKWSWYDVTFFNTLKAIQTDFEDSTAYGIDIRNYFAVASSIDYTDAFNEWYFGEGFPTYSARWNTVGNDLLVEINQTTSSSTPLFTSDIELRLARQGMNDTIVRVAINSNSQEHLIQGLGNVTQLSQIDPNNWIINNQGAVVHDLNFTGVGLNELTESLEYSIAPNPSNGYFSITTSNNLKNEVEVRDLKGRIVATTSFNQEVIIDINKEESGYYILFITNENGERRVETIVKK